VNTANVMPVQVQTGGQGKTQGVARATQSGKAASKQSFGETMGRLDQQGRDAIGAAAGDTQPGTAGTGAVVEDTPQDSLALVLAASLQGNGNLQADVEQTPESESTTEAATEAADSETDPAVQQVTDPARAATPVQITVSDTAVTEDTTSLKVNLSSVPSSGNASPLML